MSKKKSTEHTDGRTGQNNDVTYDDMNQAADNDNVTASAESVNGKSSLKDDKKAETPIDTYDDIAKKLSALNDRYLRLLAEYDNYRKRSVRDVEEAHHIATVSLIQELLPILDNLDRATEHRDDKTTLEEYVKGITLIEDQLRDALAKAGLKHLEVVGQPFDPHFHEAVMQMASDDFESGIVSQEIQKGFLLGDRVIRHSKVVVAK